MRNKSEKSRVFKLSGVFVSIIILAVVLAMATITVFNGSLGWFANNRTVNGSGMSVAAADKNFELAVSGSQVSPYNADNPVSPYGIDADILDYLEVNHSAVKQPKTSNTQRTILCALINDTPGANTGDEISPGSFGRMSFDIVANDSSSVFEIDFDFVPLYMRTLTDENVTTYEIEEVDLTDPDNEHLEELMLGHIMFFSSRTEDAEKPGYYYYSNEITTDRLIYSLSSHTGEKHVESDGDHYTVTVYWVWPFNYGQMAYPKEHPNQHAHPLFSTAAERNILYADMKAHSDKYFYNMNTVVFDENNDFVETYYVYLTEGYNNGDQYIGDRVHFLIVNAKVDYYTAPGS